MRCYSRKDPNLIIAEDGSKDYGRLRERGYAASFSYPNNIVITEKRANLKNRIKGWVVGLEDTLPSTVEECVAHEARHGIFEGAIYECTNMMPEMNEGFALATIETTLNFPELPDIMDFSIEKISAYRDLFLFAQAKGCNESELLRYIYDNKFFGTYYDERYYYTEPASMPIILKKAKDYIRSNASKRDEFDDETAMADYQQELYERRTKWHYHVVKQFNKFVAQKSRSNRQSDLEQRYKGYN